METSTMPRQRRWRNNRGRRQATLAATMVSVLAVMLSGWAAVTASAEPAPDGGYVDQPRDPSEPLDPETVPPGTDTDVGTLDVEGCVWAPGPTAFASECVGVRGHDRYVYASDSIYALGASTPLNICRRHHRISFSYNSHRYYYYKNHSGCLPAYTSGGVWDPAPYAGSKLSDNSTYCARAKNNFTDDLWTSSACVNIHD